MASIRRRNETGTLYFDFRFRGVRCREQTSLKDTRLNREKLQRVAAKIEHAIAVNAFDYRAFFPNSPRASQFEAMVTEVPAPQPEEVLAAASEAARQLARGSEAAVVAMPATALFRDFADTWYAEREIDWKRSNRIKVGDILNKHLIPRFRGRRVGDITKADILDYRAHLAKEPRDGKGLSHARINGILNILRQILDEAADRFNFTTPYRNVRPLRVPRTRVEPLSLADVRRFLDTVPTPWRPFYTVAFFTGLRTGELIGLQWDAVDLERGVLRVVSTYVYGELDDPKTEGSVRDVALCPIVIDALKMQRAQSPAPDAPFVFCARNGQPLNYRNLARRIWHPTLKTLGLAARRPYQTRHTAATLWLASGEAPEWIARQLGHASTRMLFTVYSRYVPNLTRHDGSAFARMLDTALGEHTREGGEDCHV